MQAQNIGVTILPLVGVVVGWGLTQVSSLFNLRQSNKRILKESLYFLLELHRLISIAKSFDVYTESYVKAIKQSDPNFGKNEQEYNNILKLVKANYSNFHLPQISIELNNLQENYNACLLKLSSVDPISAYRLKGKDKILDFINQWVQYANTFTAAQNEDEARKTKDFCDIVKPQLTNKIVENNLNDLEDLIHSLASQIGWRTKRRIKNLQSFPYEESLADIEENVQQHVNEIILPAMRVSK